MHWILLIVAFFAIVAAPFGFIGDFPDRVKTPEGEGLFERSVQWTSAVFHTAGPVLLVAFTESPGWLVMGALWALFGSLVLARRIAAMPTHVNKVPGVAKVFRDQWRGNLGLARTAWFAVLGLTVLVWVVQTVAATLTEDDIRERVVYGERTPITDDGPHFDWLHDITSWLVLVVAFALLVMGARLGRRERKDAKTSREVTAEWSPRLTAFLSGVSRALLEAEARMRPRPGGGVEMYVVPPAVARNLTPENRSTLDKGLAEVAPDFEIDPDTNHAWFGIRPVTPDTLRTRAELVATKGLFTTRGETAYVASPRESGSNVDADNQTIDLRDEEW